MMSKLGASPSPWWWIGSGNSEESGNPASVGVSAAGTANSGGSTEENLDVLLVEAEAQHKAAEEALKGLRDALKREKRKDEKAMADAEKKRNKMKEAMRHLEQRAQMREHLLGRTGCRRMHHPNARKQ